MHAFPLFLLLVHFSSAARRSLNPLFCQRGGEVPLYENNGGTIVAIAGQNFAVVAADTRLSKGYSILSREKTRLFEVTQGVWLGVAGCYADATALVQGIRATVAEYEFDHQRAPTVDIISQALSVFLYQRRGMPYYCFCVLVGLDSSGRGAVYNYDAVGSFERVASAAVGGSQAMILPVLDGLVKRNPGCTGTGEERNTLSWNRSGRSPRASRCISQLLIGEAIRAIHGAAAAAAERDIRLGDNLQVAVVESSAGGELASSRRGPDLELKRH